MVRVSSGPSEDHEFYTLGAEGFELFARALHGAQPGVFNTSTYGTNGFKQYGADHVAYVMKGDQLEISVGQSKAYKEFEQDGIRKAVEAFLTHWDSHWKSKSVRRFILFVGCRLRKATSIDEIIAQAQKLAAMGVTFEVWDATEIYTRLAAAQHVVRLHLGLPWVEHLFGPTNNPITSIVQDLARGDLGAVGATMLVGELNRAEEARIVELRRRIRRGAVDSARQDIDQALALPTAGALSGEVRSGLLRLSAAMNIVHGEHSRAKAELDKADELDGNGSLRQRAMLCTETLGPEKTVAGDFDVSDPEVAEVVAAAHLRLNQPADALATLRPGLDRPLPSAETLRLAALTHLVTGDRAAAVDYARRSVQREPESRACRHLLAIALFAVSITPAFDILPSDWPVPVDQSFVFDTMQARRDLEEAREIIAGLAEDSELANHREMLAWSFAIHACAPSAVPSAEDFLKRLVRENRLIGPIVAWCLARRLPLDMDVAADVIRGEREAAPGDSQLILMDVAITSQRRDRLAARALLDQGRESLIADGLEGYVNYWSSVLDMDEGRPPTQAALDDWPWLALRSAMKIRYKARRLKEITRLAENAAQPNGDPRILFATVQILIDASYSGTAARFTDALIDRIGTAEAITLAVHVLSRAGLHERALAALDGTAAFPHGRLPDDLERIRIRSNAALGRLFQAARDLSRLAAVTGSPADIWTSIEWHLAVGEVGGARELYVRHQQVLTVPSPGHLHLANAVMRSDPELATDIARQLLASAPDSLVTAVFDLTSRLRLGDEQRGLFRRIQMLGAKGEAGVELISDISVIIERMKDARKEADQTYERYCNGHVAIQMLSNANVGSLAQQYLGNLIDPPAAEHRPAPLHARYGRRYAEEIWPKKPEEASLVMDLTALLTAHGLGILDTVERAFGRIRLAPDVINVITHIHQKVTPLQPERLDATRHLVQLVDRGMMPDPSEVSPVNTFRVVWESANGDPESTLNVPALIEALGSVLGPERLSDAQSKLGAIGKVKPTGPQPGPGTTVILDSGIAIELQLAGVLDVAISHFDVCMPRSEVDQRRLEVGNANREKSLAEALDRLTARVAKGVKDGAYEFVPFDPKAPIGPVARQFFQCLRAMEQEGAILWVDDRFTTSIDVRAYPTVTTVEVMDALRRYHLIDDAAVAGARLKLRAAGWTFMPVDGAEIASAALSCTKAGEIVEDDRLRTLRRSTAWTILERKRLQWPSSEQVEKEAMGEIPFLLDQGHSVVAALVSIWSHEAVTNDDASTASSWILEHLDMSGRPPSVIPAGDPRSEFLAGLHIGHLISLAIQITPVRNNSKRKRAYIEWLWRDVIGERLRICPEMLPTVLETLERTLIEDQLDDPQQRRIWHAFCLDVVNALPDELRHPLLDRAAVRDAYDISQRGIMSTLHGDFDATEYLKTIIELEPRKEIRRKTVKGRKAKFRLNRIGEETSVTVSVGNKSAQIDDWPRRIGSDDASVRRAALGEQDASLDLLPAELDRLNEELADALPADRALKVVLLASETMSGWFTQFAGKLSSRKPIGPRDLLPDDIVPGFVRLQLDGKRGIAEAQARTIEAAGLHGAISRWSGVPVASSPAFKTVFDNQSDGELLDLARRIAQMSPAWTKLFVVRLLWDRGARCAELGELLRDVLLKSLIGKSAQDEWELLTACARFLTGDIGNRNGWKDRSVADRLAMLWSHAAELALHLLNARMEVSGFVAFLDQARLASPRALLRDQTGFAGDVANPLDTFSRRLRIHASAPILAEMVASESSDELARNAAFSLLVDEAEGMGMFARRASHGELTHLDALGSYLAEDACSYLEQIFGHEIPYLGPRIGPFLIGTINGDDPAAARTAWIQLRSAMGHGRIPPEFADSLKAAVANAPIVTTGDAVIGDLTVLLAITAIAAANQWAEVAVHIDASFDHLRTTTETGDQITTLMFETSYHRALMEEGAEQRTGMLADLLEKLRVRPDMVTEVGVASNRFADAMSGSHAQPFIDLAARIQS